MQSPALRERHGMPAALRIAAPFLLGSAVALVALPRIAAAADPTLSPTAAPKSMNSAPKTMNLFSWGGFRWQDPNMYACTSTSALDMLNFIGLHKTGGDGFIWKQNLSGAMRDDMLRWARVHDTLSGGHGSDPHGWRNLLNFFGWGASAVWAGPNRVYDDRAYGTFEGAMFDTVRALAKTRKPVGLLARGGAHAVMVTGYYGLSGNPFARDAAGNFTNKFTLSGFYVTDPLSSTKMVSRAVPWYTLKFSGDDRVRFRPYYETDSLLDDPYTPGFKPSRDEWYRRFVVILPIR